MQKLFWLSFFLLFAPTATAQIVDVQFSETFQEKLQDTYGLREGEYLSREIIEDIQKTLKRANLEVRRVEVTIEDAKPNRPTLRQLERNPTIDSNRSFGLGGMRLTGIAYDADNNPIGEAITYEWYERDLRNVVGFATWTDAHRASNRFSRRLAKKVRTALMIVEEAPAQR